MFAQGKKLLHGKCHDCAQGVLTPAKDGFEYWNEDGAGRGFWFCRHCGSNHVTIFFNGKMIEQSDLLIWLVPPEEARPEALMIPRRTSGRFAALHLSPAML
jgi:hypothetical protein